MFRCLKFIIIWPILYLGVWFLFICILQLNIDGNGLRGGANAPHNDSMYQVNHYYIRKGAPKGRDGRDEMVCQSKGKMFFGKPIFGKKLFGKILNFSNKSTKFKK